MFDPDSPANLIKNETFLTVSYVDESGTFTQCSFVYFAPEIYHVVLLSYEKSCF